MSPGMQGALVLMLTLLMLLSGAPVAFGLGAISIVFIVIFQGFDALHVVAETFYAGLNDFTLVSIPMFVMMGAAIGSSRRARISMKPWTAGCIACPAASRFPTSGPAPFSPR